jgi:hypothetical protein
MARHQDYITEARKYNKQIWDAIIGLEGLQPEWQALDYGNTLSDGEGENTGKTSAEVGSVVFATADALRALLNTGHATNMANLL